MLVRHHATSPGEAARLQRILMSSADKAQHDALAAMDDDEDVIGGAAFAATPPWKGK